MPAVARGPLAGAVLERLAAWLAAEGYSARMVSQVMAVARGLSAWMDDHEAALRGLRAEDLDRFVAEFGPGVAGHAIVSMRLPAVRRFLVESGLVAGVPLSRKRQRRPLAQGPALVSVAAEAELVAWGRWQREVRGITDGCVRYRRGWVASFVESLVRDGVLDWSACDADALNAFITERSAGFSAASCTAIVDAMRSLTRWAHASGRVGGDVSAGILRSRGAKAALPRGLTPAQVEALFAACDPTTVTGVRDRAVILTLCRLGVRAGECAGLGLDDVDWAAGRLTVIGKGQRRLTLPIPQDVGAALVDWLRVRPQATSVRAVFVRMRPPAGPLTSAGISDIVMHRAAAAGLGVMHAHRLRHTAAMNVIAAGGTLIEARELLGHTSSTSTHVYARTDLTSLRTLAVPFGWWPR